MGEYQYYEFQAIDRPLDAEDQAALRALSTRARITASSFTNHYEWGDFKGDPRRMVERWFDLHLYLTNWGARRLMIRLPKRRIERSSLNAFLTDVDWVQVWEKRDHLIVDMWRDEVEQGYDDWDDGSGWLGALAPLRGDVLSGDMRLFYLLWLSALDDGLLEADEIEPLAGIAPLTGTLKAVAEFFGIDRDLVVVAAERTDGAERAVSDDRLRDAAARPRTVAELERRAASIRRDRERAQARRLAEEKQRREEEAERARRRRLDALRQRGEAAWSEVETEIARRNAAGYDRAAALLFDLEALAAEDGTEILFARRLDTIRDRHQRKERFLERLKGLKTA